MNTARTLCETLLALVYVNKTVYLEIKKSLVQRGLLPEKKTCGSCRHLAQSKPYKCSKTGETRKKTDPPCEDYSPDIKTFSSFDAITSPGDESDDVPNTHLPREIHSTAATNIETPEMILIRKAREEQLLCILKILKERVETEKPKSKKREIYQRQYELIVHLSHACSEEKTDLAPDKILANTLKTLAKAYKIEEKTLRRDMQEIREFLKMSLNDEISYP